jgi:hypothetical protein
MTTARDILVIDDLNEVGESVCAVAVGLLIPRATISGKSALNRVISPVMTLILFYPPQ